MVRTYGIFTIAATPKFARECGVPIQYRGSAKAQTAREALDKFISHRNDGTVPAGVDIVRSDYRDTATAYEEHVKGRPLVWLATTDDYDADGPHIDRV